MKKISIFIVIVCLILAGCGKSNNIDTKTQKNEKALGEPNTPFDNIQDIQAQTETTTTEVVTTTAPNATTTAPVTTAAPKVTEPVYSEKIINLGEEKTYNINDEVIFITKNYVKCFKVKVTEIKLDTTANYEFLNGYKNVIRISVSFTPYIYDYTDLSKIMYRYNVDDVKTLPVYEKKIGTVYTTSNYYIYIGCNTDNEFQISFRDPRYNNFRINYKINPKVL